MWRYTTRSPDGVAPALSAHHACRMPGHDPPNDVLSSTPGGPSEPREASLEVRAPADVAGELGVSSSGLRRLALIYERVYGQLPRDPRLGRMWPAEAVERLALAREEVQAGRAVSIEATLSAARAGVEPRPPVQRPQDPPEPVEALLRELRSLRGAVEGMSGRLEALERENRELREAVSQASPERSPGRQLEEPTHPEDAPGDEPPVDEHLAPDQVDQVEPPDESPSATTERGLGFAWRRVRRFLGRRDP